MHRLRARRPRLDPRALDSAQPGGRALSAPDPPPVDAARVCRLIAGQFPRWADLPVRAVEPGGWDNRTFRLGPDMKVRLPSAERYAAQAAKEHRWLARLAPHLPAPIPAPLGLGAPAEGWPWPWSVQSWLPGAPATRRRLADPCRLARDLAGVLAALQRAPTTGGPPPGAHNFHRGGALAIYDAETRRALATLGGAIDAAAAGALWETARAARWRGPDVWVHGDVAAGNLLVRDGRLGALIDFGCCAVGDPACDLVIAWTLFEGDARAAFRAALPADPATWARARGWALWKASLTLSGEDAADPDRAEAQAVIEALLGDRPS